MREPMNRVFQYVALATMAFCVFSVVSQGEPLRKTARREGPAAGVRQLLDAVERA